MAPIDDLKKKIQSGKLEPLFFQLNGESVVVVPDGRKFLCPNCLVEGKDLKDSIYQCTTYCQQHANGKCRTRKEKVDHVEFHLMSELSLEDVCKEGLTTSQDECGENMTKSKTATKVEESPTLVTTAQAITRYIGEEKYGYQHDHNDDDS